MKIGTNLIRTDGGTQPREKINRNVIKDYQSDMQSGAEFPAVTVFYDGADYWLADGFHRLYAARDLKLHELEAEVHQGTRRDAILYSAGANSRHGFRRTNEDKRRAVMLLLEDEEWSELSDRDIAKHCAVTHPFVSELRKSLVTVTTLAEQNGIASIPPTPAPGSNGHSTEPLLPEPPINDRIVDPDTGEILNAEDVPQSEVVPENSQETLTMPQTPYITLAKWQQLGDEAKRLILTPSLSQSRFNEQKNDNIEWARWSWNPVTGCKHDCPYCYARDIANRYFEPGFEPSFWPERLVAPINTEIPSAAQNNVAFKNVFACSMADLFGRWVPTEWIEVVLQAVRQASRWNFLFLTKFPIRLSEFSFPDNAWVGTTVDCQARVKNAENAFRKVRAKVKWLSCEPLLEPLEFTNLEMFQWIVIGGSSRSSQTPAWYPPRHWVTRLEYKALEVGCKIYEKTNLFDVVTPDDKLREKVLSHIRIREFPWTQAEQLPLPNSLHYLPSIENFKHKDD
jgi:protein gp37